MAAAQTERVDRRPQDQMRTAADIWNRLVDRVETGQAAHFLITEGVVASLTTRLSIEALQTLAEREMALQIIPQIGNGSLQVIIQISEERPPDLWENLVATLRMGRSRLSINRVAYENIFKMVQLGTNNRWQQFEQIIEEGLAKDLKESPIISGIREGGVSDEDLEILQLLGAFYFVQLEEGTQRELIGNGLAVGNMWQKIED